MDKNSILLYKTRCPKCAENGNDRTGDNLAVYNDNHSYCYSCGYTVGSSIINNFKQSKKESLPISIVLPEDVDTTIPSYAKNWLYQYELTNKDINEHTLLWSERYKQLIFPYFVNNELLAWQGRGFNPIYPKWFSQGKLHELLYILGNKGSSLVLVEDIVSAIKLSKFMDSSPLFGCSVSVKQALRYNKFYSQLYLWLDPDKQKESIKIATTLNNLDIPIKIIYANADPKEIPYIQIKNYLCS